jgi:hypothetical protein
MTEPTAEKEITAIQVDAAVANLDFFALRLKGIIDLAGRFKALAPLLHHQDELRNRLATLRRQIDETGAEAAEKNAAAAESKRRLDGIDAELARHKAAMDSERQLVLQRAQADADSILAGARAKAETIVAEANAKAEEEAQRQAADVDRHTNAMRAVDESVAERRSELDRINRVIAELRAKIGVS